MAQTATMAAMTAAVARALPPVRIPTQQPSPFVNPFSLRLIEPVLEAYRVRENYVAGPLPAAYHRRFCALQGSHAYWAGKRASSNPYPADLITHAWWNEGYAVKGGAA